MSRPILKFGGVTDETEVEMLVDIRADFFGLDVDVQSARTITVERARQLAARSVATTRPTLIAQSGEPSDIVRLIKQIGARAVQLPAATPVDQVRQLRESFDRQELVILQAIHYAQGQFDKFEQAGAYLEAGADYLVLDRASIGVRRRGPAGLTIPEDDLVAFRRRWPTAPVLVGGGITVENVRALLRASNAAGLDVGESVRHDGKLQKELLARLLQSAGDVTTGSNRTAADEQSALPRAVSHRPTLRAFLEQTPRANQVIAYLTIGDPPDGFLDVAHEVMAAGALTLELGFPHAEPQEGAVLAASHARAMAGGMTTEKALAAFRTLANAYPQTPLVAVVQAPAIADEVEFGKFMRGLANSGAAAVLPVGQAPWQLPAFAGHVHQNGLQTVVTVPPTATQKLRENVLRYCSGSLYIPRGTVGAQPFDYLDTFCQTVARESKLPIVVGIGVKTAEDVAAICRTAAKAAVVGSALVEYITAGGSAGEFVRRLLGR